MRAAIYARYSSDNQRDASIEDQIRECKKRIDHEGWSLSEVYSDHAVSGASVLRSGYQKLLEDARNGTFDILITEAADEFLVDLRARTHAAAQDGHEAPAIGWPQKRLFVVGGAGAGVLGWVRPAVAENGGFITTTVGKGAPTNQRGANL